MRMLFSSNWKEKYSYIIINVLSFILFIVSVLILRNYNIQYDIANSKHHTELYFSDLPYDHIFYLFAILSYLILNIVVIFSLYKLIQNSKLKNRPVFKILLNFFLLMIFFLLSTLSRFLNVKTIKNEYFDSSLKYPQIFSLINLIDVCSYLSLIIFILVFCFSLKKFFDGDEYNIKTHYPTFNPDFSILSSHSNINVKSQGFSSQEEPIIHFSRSKYYSPQLENRSPNKNITKCPNCGQIYSVEDTYCEDCGKKLKFS